MVLYPNKLPESERVCSGICKQWLLRHPEDNDKEAFSEVSTGKIFTWADILTELRQQTPIGKSFEQKLNEYYIYQLNRSKK